MGNKKTIWITGAKGFVGSELCAYFGTQGYDVVGTDQEVSVCRIDDVSNFAKRIKPAVIINCAGVRRDKADLANRIKAYDVNALGARNLALVAVKSGALIVQVSSDDVYSSTLNHSVDELDTPYPDTPYGKSKRAGETMVRTITDKHLIIRSSWLYGAAARMLQEVLVAAESGKTIGMRTDHIAAPTSLLMYAETVQRLIKGNQRGTFHITTTGSVSRYDFAARVLTLAGFNPQSVLVPETECASAHYLVLKSALLKNIGIELPSWEEDLKVYMKASGLLSSKKCSVKPGFQDNDKTAYNSSAADLSC